MTLKCKETLIHKLLFSVSTKLIGHFVHVSWLSRDVCIARMYISCMCDMDVCMHVMKKETQEHKQNDNSIGLSNFLK